MAKLKKSGNAAKPMHCSLMDELRASPVQPMRPELLAPGLLLSYLGLDALAHHGATQAECADVSDVLNVSAAMLELGIVQDTYNVIQTAKNALGEAYTVSVGQGLVRLTGEGLEALQAVFTGYSDVVAVIPARSFVASVRLAQRRVREILRGVKASGDVVVQV